MKIFAIISIITIFCILSGCSNSQQPKESEISPKPTLIQDIQNDLSNVEEATSSGVLNE